MTEKQAKKIFEKYNPADSVVRCPNGRAKMRKPLDLYARAAVNLYGIIRRDEFVEIFNSQNEEQTSADEVFIILLPNVLKPNRWYGFYKEYIVHYAILSNFDWADNLEKYQSGKPRYVPPREEFLEYEWEWYVDHEYWKKFWDFMLDFFGCRPDVSKACNEIELSVTQTRNINKVGEIMDEHNLVFKDEKQVQKFYDAITAAMNNSRIWENKGHTPEEMMKMRASNPPEEPLIQQRINVGPNQSCPCGSGKKYKHCCKIIETSGSAQLSPAERKLFYETWYKLLDFVNQKYHIINMRIKPVYPSYHDESELHLIREKLWENPDVISDFLDRSAFTSGNAGLSGEEISLLQSWKKSHIKGQFILIKYEPEYAVFMLTKKDSIPALYAVKGMTTSIAEAMRRQLPVMLETVLLPFRDKIIYDSYIGSHHVSFGKGLKEMLNNDFRKIKDEFGIITRL